MTLKEILCWHCLSCYSFVSTFSLKIFNIDGHWLSNWSGVDLDFFFLDLKILQSKICFIWKHRVFKKFLIITLFISIISIIKKFLITFYLFQLFYLLKLF